MLLHRFGLGCVLMVLDRDRQSSHGNLSDARMMQVRWASCLSKILRAYRHDLKLEIPWRKMYVLLSEAHFEPGLSYQVNSQRELFFASIVL